MSSRRDNETRSRGAISITRKICAKSSTAACRRLFCCSTIHFIRILVGFSDQVASSSMMILGFLTEAPSQRILRIGRASSVPEQSDCAQEESRAPSEGVQSELIFCQSGSRYSRSKILKGITRNHPANFSVFRY